MKQEARRGFLFTYFVQSVKLCNRLGFSFFLLRLAHWLRLILKVHDRMHVMYWMCMYVMYSTYMFDVNVQPN